jgi:hypothetical protein
MGSRIRFRSGRPLRRGDVVQVRSAVEILATLDADGSLEGVPFMPEMLRNVGRRYTVVARVERACDTIHKTGVRRMPATVLLDDLRCNGLAHGGCQAGCRLYWKEAWLERVTSTNGLASSADPTAGGAQARLEALTRGGTRALRDGEEVYRCQATEFFRVTEAIGWWNVRSFVREVTCGNVDIVLFVRVMSRVVVEEVRRRLGFWNPMPLPRSEGSRGLPPSAQIAPGDLVRIRSKEGIAETLDAASKNRGLWFDHEMVPYCGEVHSVSRRVERFVDDRTGRLVTLKSDCFVLDDVVCTSYCSYGRWFCPRAIYPWWRQCWLEPVDGESRPPHLEERTSTNGHNAPGAAKELPGKAAR